MAAETFHELNEEAFTVDLEVFARKHADPRRARRYGRRLAGLRARLDRGAGGAPRLLEVGANTGAFLAAARAAGWDGVGVEPVSACARYAREAHGLDVRGCLLEEAELEAGSFDVVYSHAVLEHLTDPCGVLAEAARLLRPGGVLFVDTVNAASYTVERLGTGWRLVDPALHFCLWTPRTLRRALEGAGLRVEAMRSTGFGDGRAVRLD